MFKSVKSVVYPVSDIEGAKKWYRRVLDVEPTLDSPFLVVFPVGDSKLTLSYSPVPLPERNRHVVVYWGVDDIDSAYRRLLDLGAAPHAEISAVFGISKASVLDPFGNIFALMGTELDVNKGSIEHQPSETAMGVAFLRALAAMDEREEIRGPDYLAEVFLTKDRRARLKFPGMRSLVVPGLYEYLLARTVCFDNFVKEALLKNIPQIVFLGAGYDSRPYRFASQIKGTRIFELDAPTTQRRKKEVLKRAKIPVPEQLSFVSIDFNKNSLKDVLLKAGFDRNRETLFIWEGVTFYLTAEAVDSTLDFVRSNSPAGSSICFDYGSHAPEVLADGDVKKFMEFMRSHHPGEAAALGFGIEEGKVESFLFERGFELVDHISAKEMERKYLGLRDGSSAGKVLAFFGLVRANVSG